MPARHIVLGFSVAAAVCLFLGACDKQPQPDSPAAAATASPVSAQDEPRQTLPLVSVPLVLSVPASWTLHPPDNPLYLEGPAPGGDVRISLSILNSLGENARRVFIAAALDQAQKHPGRTQVSQSIAAGGMQILERINYTNLPSDRSSPATQPSQPLSWSLVVFVPYEHKFIPCEFDLLQLTQQQYTDDRQLIESIVDTAQPGNLASFK